MPENFRIAEMQPYHLKALAALERECFTDPWSENAFIAELTNENALFLVAEDKTNGEILGYGGMHAVCGEGYIANIAAAQKARRLGVATAILRRFLEIGEKSSFSFISLEVRPSNSPARFLYKKLGFKDVGIRPGYYLHPKEDAMIMTYYY